MQKAARRWLPILALSTWLAALAGCAEGPLARFGALSPHARKQWAEDEQYGPTQRTRLAELAQLRQQVRSMNPSEQQRTATELAQRLPDERNAVLRIAILQVLTEIPNQTASQALRAATTDSDPDVRVVACECWQRRGGPESVEVLSTVLGSDTDLDVRMAATRGLGSVRQPEATRALAIALDDSNPALQYRAVEALRGTSGRDYGNDMVAWREFARGGNPAPPPQPSLVERLRSWY